MRARRRDVEEQHARDGRHAEDEAEGRQEAEHIIDPRGTDGCSAARPNLEDGAQREERDCDSAAPPPIGWEQPPEHEDEEDECRGGPEFT